jgi:hypothetical protein
MSGSTIVTAIFDTTRAERSLKLEAPVPLVSDISPSSVGAGTSEVTLTVNGGNFVARSVVHWNGRPQLTTYVNKKRLRATITSIDLATPGSVPVTVVTPAPGGGTSTAVTFTVTVAPTSLMLSSTSTTSSTLSVEADRDIVIDNAGAGRAGFAGRPHLHGHLVRGADKDKLWTEFALRVR